MARFCPSNFGLQIPTRFDAQLPNSYSDFQIPTCPIRRPTSTPNFDFENTTFDNPTPRFRLRDSNSETPRFRPSRIRPSTIRLRDSDSEIPTSQNSTVQNSTPRFQSRPSRFRPSRFRLSTIRRPPRPVEPASAIARLSSAPLIAPSDPNFRSSQPSRQPAPAMAATCQCRSGQRARPAFRRQLLRR